MQETLASYLRTARGDRRPVDITRAGGPLPQNLYDIEKGKIPGVKTLKWLCDYYGADFGKAHDLLLQARKRRDLATLETGAVAD